jgi:pilus assembly protein CpaE
MRSADVTILWESNEQLVANVKVALGGDVTVVSGAPTAQRAVLGDAHVNLLVIGPGVGLDPALEVAANIRLERPEAGVVLMRSRLDVSVLSDAARAGVREVVSADDLGALTDACRRSQQLSARLGAATGEVAEGRLVTVFSAKGGCGKTTVSTNVSAALARQGARVLLVDLDLAFGDVAIALGLDPARTSADAVAMEGHLDPDGLASVVTRHQSGLDVLAAPKHPSDADAIKPALVNEVLRVAKRLYDVVVVDTPPAFTEHVMGAFDASDLTITLATLDILAVKNLKLALETMDLLGLPSELRMVVLNRADTGNGLSIADVAAAIGRDVEAQIPESHEVSAAANRGVPIVLQSPKHPVSVAIRALATGRVLPPDPATEAARTGRRADRAARALFRRRPEPASAEA